VVRVEGVAQPERVRGDPQPEPEYAAARESEAVRHDEREQQEETDRVQSEHNRPEARQTPTLAAVQVRHETHYPLIGGGSASALPGSSESDPAAGAARADVGSGAGCVGAGRGFCILLAAPRRA